MAAISLSTRPPTRSPHEQARALANWVAASGKNLTTIYATHGHGDHFFGSSTVLERFQVPALSRGRR